MKKWGLFLLLAYFCYNVAALDVNFSCPEQIELNSEFNCSIQVFNAAEIYDLKIDFTQNDKRVSQAWNNGWKSTNYYLIGFVNESNPEHILLRFNTNSTSIANGVVKLRKTNKTSIEFEEYFTIDIARPNDPEADEEAADDEDLLDEKRVKTEEPVIFEDSTKGTANLESVENIINLNPVQKETVIYESKNEKIKQYSIYGFCFFLIFIIILLLFNR